MRVLLDECVPRPLARRLSEHDVSTVGELGWTGVKHGELLQRVRKLGFDALVTVDQNLRYQQQLAQSGVRVILLCAPSNRLDDLTPLLPKLKAALPAAQLGQCLEIRA